jgi:hypothetical protein
VPAGNKKSLDSRPTFKCTVDLKVFNYSIQTLVDTGAMACGISEDLFLSDPRYANYAHRRTPATCISVNKVLVQTLGSIRIPLHFGKTIVVQEFEIVRDLIHPLLLGSNFLKSNRVILNFGTDELLFQDERVPLGKPAWNNLAPTHLTAHEQTIIEPESYTLIKVDIGGPNPCLKPDTERPKSLLIRAMSNDHDLETPVMAPWGVIDPYQDEIWIELLNPGSKPIRVLQGTPVAMVEMEDPLIGQTGMNPRQYSTGTVTPEAELRSQDQRGPTSNCNNAEQQPEGSTIQVVQISDMVACSIQEGHDPILEVNHDKEGDAMPELIPVDEDEDEGDKDSKNVFECSWEGTILTETEKEKFKALMDKFPEIFAKHSKDLGKTTLMHHYARVTTEKPVHAPMYRDPPPEVRKDIDRETDNLLALGVARESQSPYSAPIVLVRKKCGGWRYCTDFRKLNKVTEKVSFPLPNIQDRLRRLKNPRVMSTMDLLKGYFQIEVAENQKKIFGFSDGKTTAARSYA